MNKYQKSKSREIKALVRQDKSGTITYKFVKRRLRKIHRGLCGDLTAIEDILKEAGYET